MVTRIWVLVADEFRADAPCALAVRSCARCVRGGCPEAGRAPAAGRHCRKAHQADRDRLRRVCRPLRRGRHGRGPGAGLRLSGQGPFQGRRDRQAGRSAVQHRPPSVRDIACAGARDAGAGARQSRLHRRRSRPRLAAGEGSHHHGADLRAAHAGQTRRRGLGGGAGSGGPAVRARPSVHRTQGAGHRPDRRPARVRGQSRDRRHRWKHHDAGHDRIDRSDPLRVHLR